MSDRAYLIRIAEVKNRIIGEEGQWVKEIGAGAIASPPLGDLLTMTMPGSRYQYSNSVTFEKVQQAQESTQDLLALLPSDANRTFSAVGFTNLHFRFTSSSGKESSNTSEMATFYIYNASPEDIKKIKPEAVIVLNAGYKYQKDLPVIYAGQIVKATTYQEDVDVVTKIVCNTGFTIKKNVYINKSYPEGFSYYDVILHLLDEAAKLGFPKGNFTDLRQREVKGAPLWLRDTIANKPAGGYVVAGKLLDELEELCTRVGFICYVSHGAIYIEPEGYGKIGGGFEAFEITPEDIIGNIQPTQDASNSTTAENTDVVGVEATVFLDGRIGLNNKIRITGDAEYSGVYDIESFRTNLSYEGEEWQMTLKLIPLKGS